MLVEHLSPLRGFTYIVVAWLPRLTPWAKFFRRLQRLGQTFKLT